jgi:gas vesicle protein
MYKSVAGFLIGGLIAGTVALLYAPRSGEETRREIKENVSEAKQRASMTIEDARGRVLDTVGDLQGKAQHILESVSQEVQDKTGRLKEIGPTMVDAQNSSLEHGLEDVEEIMSS